MEVVIVLVIALVILGPKRLPDAGKAIGKGIRGFKESLTGRDEEDDPGEQPHLARTASTPDNAVSSR